MDSHPRIFARKCILQTQTYSHDRIASIHVCTEKLFYSCVVFLFNLFLFAKCFIRSAVCTPECFCLVLFKFFNCDMYCVETKDRGISLSESQIGPYFEWATA